MIDFVNICRHYDETPVDGLLRVKGRHYWFHLVDDDIRRVQIDEDDEIIYEENRYFVFHAPEEVVEGLREQTVDPFTLRPVGTSINLDDVDWFN